VRQRFSRGEHRNAPGMGLGLPIVEEIAALFDATMTLADGANGHGLAVTIRFPAG
jgi:two-component system sensor histidine kinase TctE